MVKLGNGKVFVRMKSGVARTPIERRKNMACVLAIVLLALLFMGDSLQPDKMLAPLDYLTQLSPWSAAEQDSPKTYNQLPSDKLLYIQPLKVLTGQAWRSGLPLWEPHILSGYPLIGNAQAGLFYPGTLPYVFLPGWEASNWAALFHLIAAGLGMLGYLRALGCHPLAALLGAIVFMLNASFISWLMWDSVAGTMVWLPWALWAFETALRPGRFWAVAPGAIAVAFICLAGHLQWSLYAVFALALYGAFRLVVPGGASRGRVLSVTGILLMMGTGLAALQLLPTLEYIKLGTRNATIPFDYQFDWAGFLTTWLPRFFGFGSFVGPEWHGPLNYNEVMTYVGVAPLVLALVAMVWRRDARTIFFGGLGLLGAFSAAGTGVYRLLYWLPGFNNLPPQRMRYLVVVSLSVLCALGFDWLIRQSSARRTRCAISVGLMAGGLGLAYLFARTGYLPADADQLDLLQRFETIFAVLLATSAVLLAIGIGLKRWGRFALAGVCVITLVDLWQFGVTYQRPMPKELYYPTTPGLQLLTSDPDLFRVLTVRREGDRWQLLPNLPTIFGLYNVGGYDSTYMRRYLNYMRAIDKAGSPFPEWGNLVSPSEFNSPLVDLLNVKYALTPDDVHPPGWELVYQSELRIYRRTDPWPRAWIASRAQVLSGANAILAQLAAPEFDPRRTVILEQDPAEPVGEDSTGSAGRVSIDRYENTQLVLNAQMQRPGWLVLSEVYYAGWHATVDGLPASLYRADFLFRAVPLPAGQHRVELTFMPDSFVTGAAISLGAAILLLLIVIASRLLPRPC